MKKKMITAIAMLSAAFLLAGCGDDKSVTDEKMPYRETESLPETDEPENLPGSQEQETQQMEETQIPAPAEIVSADWSGYFHGLAGSAVIYMPAQNKYMIYNEELSDTRRSPCSTFKIISSLMGIEEGIIRPDDSVRKWSGETFWNEKWNRDIDFKDAFQASCIWYFREVTDELGEETVRSYLDRLQYGNRDCSDWGGHLNNNNNNPALTGFWVESSLKISPREQTEVMERIFGRESVFAPQSLKLLEDAMLVKDLSASDVKIYGKTGMGKSEGVTVDAWYTGFFESDNGRAYFCIYLGRSDGMDVSSAEAKNIALQIIGRERL